MRLRKLLKVFLFNAVLLFLLMESVALAGYYAKTGKVYYLDPPSGRSAPTHLDGVVEAYRLHPYMGFVIRPSRASNITAGSPGDERGNRYNNHGFDSPVDFPYLRRGNELLVGVFGGSAASKLAVFESREKILTTLLAEALGRDPQDIKVLNFAQGGYTQPQQLLIYTYFLALGQELDLVINFDGFNDVALAARNLQADVTVDMPSIEHMRGLQEMTAITHSAGGIERMLRVRSYWSKYSSMLNRAWGGEAWELTFASGFMVDWIIYRRYQRLYEASRLEATGSDNLAGTLAEESWIYLSKRPPQEGGLNEASLNQAIDLWASSSERMHATAGQLGALYLHFVQPNQYFETERTYSEAERETAINPGTAYEEPIRMGYPKLEARLEILRQKGIIAEGLFRLLDDVEPAVYIDDCCHFTDAGQSVLARHIGQVAAREFSQRRAQRPPGYSPRTEPQAPPSR